MKDFFLDVLAATVGVFLGIVLVLVLLSAVSAHYLGPL